MVSTNYQNLASSDALHNYAKKIKQYKRLKDILEAHDTRAKNFEFQNLAGSMIDIPPDTFSRGFGLWEEII